MTRKEIIDLVVVRNPETTPGGHQQLRRVLEAKSATELDQMYDQILLEAKEEELIRIQAERSAERALYQLHLQRVTEPQRKAEEKAQLAQDKQTFADAAKTLRSFGMNEANFNVIRQTLGAGFSVYSVQQLVQANAAILSPPTQEESNEWTRQDIEEHNRRLLSADLPTLRRLTREAGARGPAVPQPDETQRVRAAEEKFYYGTYPLLPDEFRDGNGPEQVLNAEFIRNCSKETLRLLLKRYGADQVNEVLRTRINGIYQY